MKPVDITRELTIRLVDGIPTWSCPTSHKSAIEITEWELKIARKRVDDLEQILNALNPKQEPV